MRFDFDAYQDLVKAAETKPPRRRSRADWPRPKRCWPYVKALFWSVLSVCFALFAAGVWFSQMIF